MLSKKKNRVKNPWEYQRREKWEEEGRTASGPFNGAGWRTSLGSTRSTGAKSSPTSWTAAGAVQAGLAADIRGGARGRGRRGGGDTVKELHFQRRRAMDRARRPAERCRLGSTADVRESSEVATVEADGIQRRSSRRMG